MSKSLISFGLAKNFRSLISILNGLLISIILVNNFSVEIASEWFFIANIAALFMVSDLSLSTSIARINSTAIAMGSVDKANAYIANALSILVLTATAMSLLFWLNYDNISSDIDHLNELFIFVLMISILQGPLKIFDGILLSKLYLNRQIVCDLIGGLIKLSTLIYYYHSMRNDIQSLGIIYFGSSLFVSLLKVYVSRQASNLYFDLSINKIRDLAQYSAAAFTMSAGNTLTRQIFLLVAFYLVSAEDYVLINLVYLFYFNTYQIQTTFLSAIGPVIVDAKVKLNSIELNQRTSQFLKYTKVISLSIFALLIIAFYPTAKFFYNYDTVSILTITATLLIGNVVFLFTYSSLIYRSALNYMSLHWFVSKAEFLINFIILVLSVIMLKYTELSTSVVVGFCLISPMILRSFVGYGKKFSEVVERDL